MERPERDVEDPEFAAAHSKRLWSAGSAPLDANTINRAEPVPVRLWTVVYSVLTTCLLTILVGATIAFSSPALLQLKELKDPNLHLDIQLLDLFGVSTYSCMYALKWCINTCI